MNKSFTLLKVSTVSKISIILVFKFGSGALVLEGVIFVKYIHINNLSTLNSV